MLSEKAADFGIGLVKRFGLDPGKVIAFEILGEQNGGFFARFKMFWGEWLEFEEPQDEEGEYNA